MMDADLQNDPTDIPMMLDELDEGYDVVSGWRKKRQDTFLARTLPSPLANGLISSATGVHLHDYGCTLKAYRREVITGFRLYGEMTASSRSTPTGRRQDHRVPGPPSSAPLRQGQLRPGAND